MVSIVRMGAETHSANTDQRRLELCGASTVPCGGSNPTLQIPERGVSIPGYWMVFGLGLSGTPSIGVNLNIN